MNQEEWIDQVDWETGLPMGASHLRSKIHQEAIPHRAVHLWIYLEREGELYVLLQQRAWNKPNYPGRFAASIGGHLRAGEEVAAIVREGVEEIGVQVAPKDLQPLGSHRIVFDQGDYHDREWIVQVAAFTQQPLEAFQFQDGEVIGLAAVRQADLADFIHQSLDSLPALFWQKKRLTQITIQRDELVDDLFGHISAQRLLDLTRPG